MKTDMHQTIAMILAGGTGTRMGASVPKQFIKVRNKPILAYTLEIYQNNPAIDAIEVVCHKDWIRETKFICDQYHITKMKWICDGGMTFSDSTMKGIHNLKEKICSNDIVLVSFAASPMVSQEEVCDCIRVCEKHGNAIAAASMDLLLGVIDDGSCSNNTKESCDRRKVMGLACPWAFQYGELLQVCQEAEDKSLPSTVEPYITSLYLALGRPLWFSKHDRHNIKITYPEDLDIFRGYLMIRKENQGEDAEAFYCMRTGVSSCGLNSMDLYMRRFPGDFIHEIDSLQKVESLKNLLISSVNGNIYYTICHALQCVSEEIADIHILDKGLTNILFSFVVRGKKYVFRYPGSSSSFYINRKNECVAQKLASQVHVDNTCIYIDEAGIKISEYREDCIDLHGIYYYDLSFMKRLARQIRKIHHAGYSMENPEEYTYDPVQECWRLFQEASRKKGNLLEIFKEEWADILCLQRYADLDNVAHTMCHNDINADNILLTNTTLDIIDWEFAGYNDPGYDFGRVIAGMEYDADAPEVLEILEAYFERPATRQEHLHFMAYSAIHNWYYVGWALYKESIGESTRDWMLYFYRQARKLTSWCLSQYEAIYNDKNERT